jgi:DNA-binding YbaB/EbfC family protein
MLKGLGDLGKMGGIIKQAMEMKSRIEELKDQMGDMEIPFAIGGDMVSVVMSGAMEVKSLKISQELLDQNDPEMLESMVQAAMNGAIAKAQETIKAKMTELTGGVDIPGIV